MPDPIVPETGDWVLWARGDRPHLGRVVRRLGERADLDAPLYHVETGTGGPRRQLVSLDVITTVIHCGGDDGRFSELRDLLRHDNPRVRQMALRVLADLGDDDG